jgi:hypothetical protein
MEAVCENYPQPLKGFCIGIAKTYLAGVFWGGQGAFDEARGIFHPTPEEVREATERQNNHEGRSF